MKLKFQEKELELIPIWYSYLYPYLIRFISKNHLEVDWNEEEIIIHNEILASFKSFVERALSELLDDCYVEPSHKKRSKFSSRYQKIDFREKKYVLDYRTDMIGIIGYGLFHVLSVIDSC